MKIKKKSKIKKSVVRSEPTAWKINDVKPEDVKMLKRTPQEKLLLKRIGELKIENESVYNDKKSIEACLNNRITLLENENSLLRGGKIIGMIALICLGISLGFNFF